jgi:hypothetical protein
MSYKITDDEDFNREVIGCIRSKVLQRLLIIYWNVFYNMSESEIAKRAFERLKRKEKHPLLFCPVNVAYALRPEDIMSFLHVSKRTAWEYIKFFREIMG